MWHEVFRHHLLAACGAHPRERFIEADFALRQRHHRLEINIHAAGFDRLADAGAHALGIERLEASPGGSRRSSFGRRDHRRGDGSRLAGCSGVRGGAASQRRLMHRNRLGQLLYQKAQFADLRRDRIDRGVRTIDRALQLALGGGKAVLELGHLLGEVGGDTRQVGDLIADVIAVAQAARDGVVKHKPGQRGQTCHGRFRAGQTEEEIENGAYRARNEHHADSDKDGGKPEHAIPEVQIQLCQKSDFAQAKCP